MEKNSGKFSMNQAAQLASSEAGQQLFQKIRQQQGGAFDRAVQQANAGDYSALQKAVEQLLATPEGQALAKKLGG